MTTLYKKKEQGSNWTYIGMEEATLSDLKAALEEHGMVAVNTEALCYLEDNVNDDQVYMQYMDMIKAAQEKE